MTATNEANEATLTSYNLSLHDKSPRTCKLYLAEIRRFAATLKEGDLLDAERRDVRRYFAELQAAGLARATIRSRWIVLKSFYNWCVAEEEIDAADDPMRGVKVDKADPPPPSFLDDTAMSALLKSMTGKGVWDRRDLAMVRLAAATGMRISELLALTLEDVDLARRAVFIRHGKGDKSRLVSFDVETGAVLDRYMRARGRHKLGHLNTLFICRFGPLQRQGASHMLKRRCIAAGIAPIGWHQLRHRFAHTYLARGGNEGALARLGGWSDPAVMRRYGASLADQRAHDEYEKLGGVL